MRFHHTLKRFIYLGKHRFLSPEALEGVLEYCREATVFFDIKIGHLGAYLNDGFTRYADACLSLPASW